LEAAFVIGIADRVELLLAPILEESGFHLLLCELVSGGRGPILRLYIERLDGEAVGISDCVAVNNTVTDVLDAEDLVPQSYVLEVSSPGVERPLKKPNHFEEQIGKRIALSTWEPIEKRKNWKGTLIQVEGDVITIRVDEGTEHRLPLPAIERAKVVFIPEGKGKKMGGSARKKRRAGRR
jgi:ribosome maturation factor RimP